MASINYAAKEISVKIVYYGPGLSGKTTNLQVIHRKTPPQSRSDMVSLATETDRTLFFDFLPIDLGTIKGFATKFQLYTVPGQVYYNATRKLVLRGVDGLVFVADSSADKMQENFESFQNLEDNLAEYGYKRENIPIVLQYNKRDMPNALPVEEIDRVFNKYHCPWNEGVAYKGKGVFESLKMIGKLVIDNLNRKYNTSSVGSPLGARPVSAASQTQPTRPTQAPSTQQAPSFMPMGPGGMPMQQRPTQPMPTIGAAMQAPAQRAPAQQQQQSPSSTGEIVFEPQQATAPRAAPAPEAQPFQQQWQPTQPQQAQQPQFQQQWQPQQQQPQQQPQQWQQQPQQQAPQAFQQPQQAQPPQFQQQWQPQQQPPQQQWQQQPQQAPQAFQQPQQAPQQQQWQQPAQPQQQWQQPAQQQPAQQQPPQQQWLQPAQPQQPQQQAPQAFQQQPGAQDAGDADGQGEEGEGDAFDDTMYFTSVNTERPRKKGKRPVNPKTQQGKGIFGKLFNKGE